MIYDQIVKKIEEIGLSGQIDDGFIGMEEYGCSPGRVLISELRDSSGYHGVSFWVCKNNNQWYLGLWSSRLYSIESSDELIDVIRYLFGPNGFVSGSTPAELPIGLDGQFSIQLIE